MSDNKHITPKVGVTTIIRKGNLVLLGERISKKHGNTWFFPSGHLEVGERILDCARRETLEETGLEINNLRLSPYLTEDIFTDSNNHYISLFTIADYAGGEATVVEPDKCAQWGWFSWNNLPKPYFIGLKNFLENKYDPFI